jgi:8-oxo-dGTP pyrophosphatase MutT (NUDIX family)
MQFTLPGGKRETRNDRFESCWDTMKREFEEEIGESIH